MLWARERHTDWLTTELARTRQLQRNAKSSRNFWIPLTTKWHLIGMVLSQCSHDHALYRQSNSSHSQAQQSTDKIHTGVRSSNCARWQFSPL